MIVFGLEFENKLLPYLKSNSRICQNAKFNVKEKKINLGPELPNVGIFRLEFSAPLNLSKTYSSLICERAVKTFNLTVTVNVKQYANQCEQIPDNMKQK